jgi:hypothetical protein
LKTLHLLATPTYPTGNNPFLPLVDDGNTDRANTNDYDWPKLFSFLCVVG